MEHQPPPIQNSLSPSEESTGSANPMPSTSPQTGLESSPNPSADSSKLSSDIAGCLPLPPPPDPMSLHEILNLPIGSILVEDPTNGRLEIDHDHVLDLANQIIQTGLLNPITVAKSGELYILVAGRHRLAAFHHLARPTIPATVIPNNALTIATARLAENSQRSNLSPVEEALQLAALVELHPQAVDGVATAVGRSVNWVLDRLDIRSWPIELQDAVHNKRISLGAAKRLARIRPIHAMNARINDAITSGINVRTASLWLQDSQQPGSENFELSEKDVTPKSYNIECKSELKCVLCLEFHDIIRTHNVRVCSGCLEGLQAMQSPQPSVPS